MDLISRQAAIDALANTKDLVDVTWTDENDNVIDSIEEKRNIIANWLEKVPSAQPERKKGEWIRNDNGTYSCSACQSWIPEEQHYYARYCLYCGADMRGEQDE